MTSGNAAVSNLPGSSQPSRLSYIEKIMFSASCLGLLSLVDGSIGQHVFKFLQDRLGDRGALLAAAGLAITSPAIVSGIMRVARQINAFRASGRTTLARGTPEPGDPSRTIAVTPEPGLGEPK
jgi:hypothetical protein